MSKENQHENAEWNFETARREREERMAMNKSGDGQKKPIEVKSPLSRFLFPVISVVLVLAIITWGAFALGLPQKYLSPLTIGQRKVSVIQYNFFYNTLFQQYNQYARQGMIPADASGNIDMNALTGMGDKYSEMTWGEFLTEATHEQIRRVEILNDQAEKNGVQLSEENKQKIDAAIESATKQFSSKTEAENSLIRTYGRGMSLDILREMQGKILLADQFVQEYPKTFAISSEDAEKYYAEHKDEVDVVTYRQFTMSVPGLNEEEQKLSAEEQKKLIATNQEKLKETAQTFLNGVQDEQSFIAMAKEYADPNMKEEYEDAARTLVPEAYLRNIQQADLAKWLKDPSRKLGDKTVFSNGNAEQLVFFISRERPEAKLPTVGRIIFPNPEVGNQGQASIEAAKMAKDSMLALAEESLEKVTDRASLEAEAERLQSEGENVRSMWLEHLNPTAVGGVVAAWLNDSARQSGDKKVFVTRQGIELILFAYAGEKPAWEVYIETTLQADKMDEKIKAWEDGDDYKVVVSDFAMRFVDKLAKNTVKGADLVAQKSSESSAATSIETTVAQETSSASSSSETEVKPAATTAAGESSTSNTESATTTVSETSTAQAPSVAGTSLTHTQPTVVKETK